METTLELQAKEEELQSIKDSLELKFLSKLEELKSLEKLDQLEMLSQLDSLSHLEKLDQVERLSILEKLDQLQNLSQLEKLIQLEKLDQLSQLQKLDQLQNLTQLEKLIQLEKLENLGQLENLKDLDKLKALDNIKILETILQNHKQTLAPIEKLVELKNLTQLEHLRDLSQLEQLSALKLLEKLDLINDPQFHQNLNKLDQLDILKAGSRKIAIQQGAAFIFEMIKIVIVSALMIFILTRESSQEIISKALPAIGLGQSSQVNLGLKLLLTEQSPEEFALIVNDVKSRIKNEVDIVFSASSFNSLHKRLSVLENLQNYSFKSQEVDLKQEASNMLSKKSALFFSESINKLEYESALAKSKDDTKLYNVLREVKLLLSQEKFSAALEKSYGHWNRSEALRNATIISATRIFQDDPRTLEEIIKDLPPLQGSSL